MSKTFNRINKTQYHLEFEYDEALIHKIVSYRDTIMADELMRSITIAIPTNCSVTMIGPDGTRETLYLTGIEVTPNVVNLVIHYKEDQEVSHKEIKFIETGDDGEVLIVNRVE